MRNILKAAFIVIAILAISCDKSEDLSSKDLVGSWYLESVTYGGQPQGLSSCAKQSNIVFTETEYTKTEYAGIDDDLCSETHKKTELFRQFLRRFGRVDIGNVPQFLRLLRQRGNQIGMTVSQRMQRDRKSVV